MDNGWLASMKVALVLSGLVLLFLLGTVYYLQDRKEVIRARGEVRELPAGWGENPTFYIEHDSVHNKWRWCRENGGCSMFPLDTRDEVESAIKFLLESEDKDKQARWERVD